MKLLSESKAIEKLDVIRNEFRELVQREYEHCARSCAACDTPGACCLDAHFVNVRITKLEAVAIRNVINELPIALQKNVAQRIETLTYDEELTTYACPLFEKGIGCLVHDTAKPLPCIAHACYERKEDLPPDELLTEREIDIERLNQRVYGNSVFLPIPTAIKSTGL